MNLPFRQLAGLILLLVVACGPAVDDDAQLAQRVSAAIAAASDLPQQGLELTVTEGRVLVTGALDCPECGGSRTPGGSGTVQQSLGAVIRAVPGVRTVSFELTEDAGTSLP
jgi:hypothetical protein